MPPLKRAVSSVRGIGYAGDARGDSKIRKKLQKTTQQQEQQISKTQEDLLRKGLLAMTTKREQPESEFIKVLTSILRNQADWSLAGHKKNNHKLYDLALDCCEELSQAFPHLLGKDDDEESLLFALQEMMATAKIISEHSKDYSTPVRMLARRALTLGPKAYTKARLVIAREDLELIDPQTQYRTQLRPHAFGFVDSLPHHAYANELPSVCSSRKKILRELSTYQSALPVEFGSSIFVRVMEHRMDLVRCLILGPDESPYGSGCFFFDICLGSSYPHKPPKVKFLTTGGGKYRFNPNLYQDGKVCLSLLGTWSGPGWQSGESTLLQVLVSIQSLIFVDKPYFNEPGFQQSEGTPIGELESQKYNSNIRRYTMGAAMLPHFQRLGKPTVWSSNDDIYKAFDNVIRQHFELKEHTWKHQLIRWRQDAREKISINAAPNQRRQQGYRSMAKTGPTTDSLYLGCLDAWNQGKTSSRKNKAKKTAEAAAGVVSTAREVNGVFEIDLDEDNLSGSVGIFKKGSNDNDVPKGSSKKDNALGVIEIDLEDDDDRVAVTQRVGSSFKLEAQSSMTNAQNEGIIDLT